MLVLDVKAMELEIEHVYLAQVVIMEVVVVTAIQVEQEEHVTVVRQILLSAIKEVTVEPALVVLQHVAVLRHVQSRVQ